MGSDWQPVSWRKAYGRVMRGEVALQQPRLNEEAMYGPRYRWSVDLVRERREITSGFADTLEAASAAADAWVASLAAAAVAREGER